MYTPTPYLKPSEALGRSIAACASWENKEDARRPEKFVGFCH